MVLAGFELTVYRSGQPQALGDSFAFATTPGRLTPLSIFHSLSSSLETGPHSVALADLNETHYLAQA